MLQEIGSPDNIPKALARAKDKNDPFRLMGFGHRVYKYGQLHVRLRTHFQNKMHARLLDVHRPCSIKPWEPPTMSSLAGSACRMRHIQATAAGVQEL